MEIEFRETVPEGLEVIETMRQEADGSVALWPLHLARLRRDCAAVGFSLDEGAAEKAVQAARPHGSPARLRLTVNRAGHCSVIRADLPPVRVPWLVSLSPVTLSSTDPWLRIKTTHRPAYEAARASMPEGRDEVILLNERAEVCEGTITSLFLERDGLLLTPPLSCGLLPGVLRQSLLDQGRARKAVLLVDDLAEGHLFMGNALRGLIPAQLTK